MTIFSLEMFQADKGDSLLLHYGDNDAPKFLLIDGGPKRSTFIDTTANRLNELREKFPTADNRLLLQMVMVSHIDDDHIDGLLAMTDFLTEKQEDQQTLPYDIRTFWFNSFDEILGNQSDEIFNGLIAAVDTASVDGTFPEIDTKDRYAAAVVSSVNQGRRLRRDIKKLGVPLNSWPNQRPVDGLSGMVTRPESGQLRIQWDEHLTLTILAPDVARLKRLRSKWDAAIREQPDLETLATIAAFDDTSVANLSSIVVLAECEGSSMLLTGDARGDDIIAGVDEAGLFDHGKMQIDLLKLPHHGSNRNVTQGFFEQFPATHYVASGNGEHGNPELVKTIEQMLEPARPADDFTLHLSNRTGKDGFTDAVNSYLDAKSNRNREYRVNFRDADSHSIIVDLLDPVNY